MRETSNAVPARPQPASLGADPAARGRALLEAHLDLIQRKLHYLSWRSGLPECEAEEFRSWALFKLIDNDYRLLGQWEERSTFPTFLRVVLVNLMRDYRIHLWGKWRPTATSRRHGRASVLLERLVVRDGLPIDEAVERLRTEQGISVEPEEVVRLAAMVPRSHERRLVGEEELLHIPVDGEVEVRVEESERARTVAQLRQMLVPLLRSLSAEERLILRMSFFEGLTMAAISRALHRPQRELYSARERCLKKLRRSLEEVGLGAEQIRELLGRLQGSLELQEQLGDARRGSVEKVRPVRLTEQLVPAQ